MQKSSWECTPYCCPMLGGMAQKKCALCFSKWGCWCATKLVLLLILAEVCLLSLYGLCRLTLPPGICKSLLCALRQGL